MFVTVTDPISSGFAADLAHPGGNITGFTVDDAALGGKWVGTAEGDCTGVPRAWRSCSTRAGPPLQFFMPSIRAAASSNNVQVSTATVHLKDEIEVVIAAQARDQGGGLIVMPKLSTPQIVNDHCAGGPLPRPGDLFSVYCAQSGGLIGYGTDYANRPAKRPESPSDRILKGAKPADLPVQAPTESSW